MAVQTISKTGMEKWQDGVDAAVQDPRWASHDCEIQTAVNEFNRHLSGIAGYVHLDWQIIKAMLWVESGPHKTEWNSKPMQIGVVGDPGLHSLLYGQEGGDLILPPAWRSKLTVGSVRTIPAHNIRAGIGYLLMRMASFEHRASKRAGNGRKNPGGPGPTRGQSGQDRQGPRQYRRSSDPTQPHCGRAAP